MKCNYTPCQVEIPDGLKVKGRVKRFCCSEHRTLAWHDEHTIKRKHPKRIRSRERERLQRMITKKTPLFRLKILADGYEPTELAERFESWVCGMILRGNR